MFMLSFLLRLLSLWRSRLRNARAELIFNAGFVQLKRRRNLTNAELPTAQRAQSRARCAISSRLALTLTRQHPRRAVPVPTLATTMAIPYPTPTPPHLRVHAGSNVCARTRAHALACPPTAMTQQRWCHADGGTTALLPSLDPLHSHILETIALGAWSALECSTVVDTSDGGWMGCGRTHALSLKGMSPGQGV